jgi:hypothetical protein
VNIISLTAFRFSTIQSGTSYKSLKISQKRRTEHMTSFLLLLWALTGGAVATWLMMHIWLPDPPPDLAGRYLSILIAGIVGGILGGFLVHGSQATTDSLPAIVGAAGAGLILSGAVAFLGAARRTTAG